ncbi:DUF2190 family protein [Aminobacterium sp. UBA5514]|jgi:predicted RecA/RadA family phage recombinase|uniref:DUF2190 family protein n=1 Tax=Aminobacterium sp. UBA5514 TaxID=1946036 RepID=UPI0025799A4E|nr:DUF2190 family protein [Aminobacterium sp. UBA5514]
MSKEAVYLQEGKVIDWKNDTTSNVLVGEVIPFKNIVGIAVTNIAIGDVGAVSISGVYQMPAVKTTAFEVGDKLYWNDTANQLTATATDNTYAGICVEPKNSATEIALIKLG